MKVLRKLLVAFLILGVTLSCVSKIFAFTVPPYDGPLNDFADILSSQTEEQLETELLSEANTENGVEVAVVTLPSLSGEPIEDVALQFFDTWKIGKKRYDNGVLLLLAIKEREVRIQTGYGAETFLPDALTGRIIRETMIPQLKNNNYDEAIRLGVQEILEISRNVDQEELANEQVSKDVIVGIIKNGFSIIAFFVTFFTYLAAYLGRSKAWWPGGVFGGILGWMIYKVNGAIALALFGFLLDYLLSKNYKTWQEQNKPTDWRSTWGGFRMPTTMGRTGGGGFTFGGGRTGGGGASGKW